MVGLGRAARSIDATAVQVTAPDPDGQPDTYQKPLAKETATAVRTALLKARRPSLSIESRRTGVWRLPVRRPSRSCRLADCSRGNCRPQPAKWFPKSALASLPSRSPSLRCSRPMASSCNRLIGASLTARRPVCSDGCSVNASATAGSSARIWKTGGSGTLSPRSTARSPSPPRTQCQNVENGGCGYLVAAFDSPQPLAARGRRGVQPVSQAAADLAHAG